MTPNAAMVVSAIYQVLIILTLFVRLWAIRRIKQTAHQVTATTLHAISTAFSSVLIITFMWKYGVEIRYRKHHSAEETELYLLQPKYMKVWKKLRLYRT